MPDSCDKLQCPCVLCLLLYTHDKAVYIYKLAVEQYVGMKKVDMWAGKDSWIFYLLKLKPEVLMSDTMSYFDILHLIQLIVLGLAVCGLDIEVQWCYSKILCSSSAIFLVFSWTL